MSKASAEKQSLLHSIASLYGVHCANYLAPLITFPYLAHVLGPGTWGGVAFIQAFAYYLTLLVDYGFDLAGTREVAQRRNDREYLAALVSAAMAAKMLLGLGVVALAALIFNLVPVLAQSPALFWSGVFWGVFQGMNLLWYYQGMERMRWVAAFEIMAKTVATGGIFLFIRRPEDAWMVLALQAAAAFLSLMVSATICLWELGVAPPRAAMVRQVFRLGWQMFLFRGSISLYTVSNVFILGLFAPPSVVGWYAGAEKIAKAFVGLFTPIGRALYPRISNLARHAMSEAAGLVRKTSFVLVGAGLCMCIGISVVAPLLVKMLLGSEFRESVPLLRIMALLPPLIAGSTALGVLWMMPLGMEKSFNRIVAAAGICNVLLGLVAAPIFGATGMACVAVFAETVVSGGVCLHLLTRRKSGAVAAMACERESA